ncbi:MAG: uroporphyrinogen-III synthase [Bdellovibrionales bacterium]|nr:uroporphyrinogen-III synthase [Bdellovibrionales bacterium]
MRKKLPNNPSLPLEGVCVAITRPEHQVGELARKIEAIGGCSLALPTISVCPSPEPERVEDALRKLDTFDWVIFTSANGVRAAAEIMNQAGVPLSDLQRCKIAAIGPATALELNEIFQVSPDCVPEKFISDELPDAIGDVSGKRFLLPRADIARKELAVVLRERGAEVVEVSAYSVVSEPSDSVVQQVSQLSDSERPDFFTVTSSSTVRGLISLLKKAGKEHWIHEVPFASIGPITSQTAIELGVTPVITAQTYSVEGLIRAFCEYFETREHFEKRV